MGKEKIVCTRERACGAPVMGSDSWGRILWKEAERDTEKANTVPWGMARGMKHHSPFATL